MIALLVFLTSNQNFILGRRSCRVCVISCKLVAIVSLRIKRQGISSSLYLPHRSASTQAPATKLSIFRLSSPLLYFPDGDFSVLFSSSTEDIPVLSRAERRHFVVVAVQLFQDLVVFCVQDVNLPFGRTAANTANPYLERKRILKPEA